MQACLENQCSFKYNVIFHINILFLFEKKQHKSI